MQHGTPDSRPPLRRARRARARAGDPAHRLRPARLRRLDARGRPEGRALRRRPGGNRRRALARAIRHLGHFGRRAHVLACAALCDERLVAVASLAAVAPYEADGLDWLEGMGEENHVEFGKTLAGESVLRPLSDRAARSAASGEARGTGLRDGDAARRGGLRRPVGAVCRVHARVAARGTRAGSRRLDRRRSRVRAALGVRHRSIDRPVLLLHGADDRFVPVSHGHWLAARIPGVEARSPRPTAISRCSIDECAR